MQRDLENSIRRNSEWNQGAGRGDAADVWQVEGRWGQTGGVSRDSDVRSVSRTLMSGV